MKSIKQLGYVLMVLALMVIATGCGGGNNNTDSDDGTSGSLVVSGSSAMQPLIAAAAEEFMAENPNADIQVNAGGSGTGLSQVSEGSVDIGNSDVYAEEKEGIDAAKLVDHKVAVVGIAAAVNPNVGITDISKEDLIKVFTGKITNWKDVGGKDQKIVLVNRPDSSGTRAVFNKFGLDGATPAEGITEDSSNTVKKILKETEGAVGYLAFSYFTDDSVKALSVDGVEAKEENVQAGKFPIWAYQHSYTKGEATGLGKSFLDYVMSDDIQSTLLKEQGYLPVTEMKVERDAEGNLKNL
ncbi:phosphate ABC transporter substrate-binding protein (plasmid) [Niallia taxi]|uniref:phosphate ABC transporter substrate-binding protein n=1 Tax=Niallia taxi TaxID=2499688 RepID=UPI0021A44435|nr:phosphate ABC transporter substrate-binding protein [Niallia taxi]MCT2344989.1 phosphate ABC transporter substrate-binding protein [Niallia taxi]WOD65612.1 phosphate ABC transporter substrate-binding protein [Niallia taxi]